MSQCKYISQFCTFLYVNSAELYILWTKKHFGVTSEKRKSKDKLENSRVEKQKFSDLK